jgi:hypothetical protein
VVGQVELEQPIARDHVSHGRHVIAPHLGQRIVIMVVATIVVVAVWQTILQPVQQSTAVGSDLMVQARSPIVHGPKGQQEHGLLFRGRRRDQFHQVRDLRDNAPFGGQRHIDLRQGLGAKTTRSYQIDRCQLCGTATRRLLLLPPALVVKIRVAHAFANEHHLVRGTSTIRRRRRRRRRPPVISGNVAASKEMVEAGAAHFWHAEIDHSPFPFGIVVVVVVSIVATAFH